MMFLTLLPSDGPSDGFSLNRLRTESLRGQESKYVQYALLCLLSPWTLKYIFVYIVTYYVDIASMLFILLSGIYKTVLHIALLTSLDVPNLSAFYCGFSERCCDHYDLASFSDK
jgi:hypothetical protein